MMVSATIKLDRCPFRHHWICDCDVAPVEVEHHVVGVVDGVSGEWLPEVLGVADEDGDVVELTGKELTWAEDALCEEAERQEKLTEAARLPYVIEGGRC